MLAEYAIECARARQGLLGCLNEIVINKFMKIAEIITDIRSPSLQSMACGTTPPQYAIVPIPQKPEPDPVDPYLASLLRTKKLELDNKHMAVRLKRCRKGQPPKPDWEQTWANYKATVLQKLVSEYQPPIGTATIASSRPQPPLRIPAMPPRHTDLMPPGIPG